MDSMINLKDRIAPILIGGTVCTGNDAASACAAHILNEKGYSAGPISIGDCLRQAYGLGKGDSREKFFALCEGKEDNPFVAELVANSVQVEPDSIIVISGLRRKCDAEYFYEEFPYSHFVMLYSDNDTLVERIVRRNSPKDFPPGVPEEQKPEIARRRLAEEEKVYEITALLAYILKVPCKKDEKGKSRGYVVDTSKYRDCAELELDIRRALMSFGIE